MDLFAEYCPHDLNLQVHDATVPAFHGEMLPRGLLWALGRTIQVKPVQTKQLMQVTVIVIAVVWQDVDRENKDQ